MIQRDYNGAGKWTVGAVRSRYTEYAARLSVERPVELSPQEHVRGEIRWVYPIMDAVIEGIKAGDTACSTIGVEFIEEDQKFPFGSNLKARTARALRQSTLSLPLIVRIRRRVTDMLKAGNTPREYREYVKLLRRVGFSELWPRIEANAPLGNKYAMRYYGYLRDVHERSPSMFAGER
jgi:hypothetical protein